MYTFETTKLEHELMNTDLKIKEVELVEESDTLYIFFENSWIRYIKAPNNFQGIYNCISIYHGETNKHLFLWDEDVDYQKLAKELMFYHNY